FEYFITEDLLVLEEVTGVVWYTGDPNCRFVVAFLDEGEWRFFDVDYVTREIREITKEEAIEKVKTIGVDEQEAKELLGLEGLLGCIC
ncbi:MAG: hypothetical protein H5T92_10125, partial [Synergistales bacterium]|nr:hypothetical protein [Synergistales bacterium]